MKFSAVVVQTHCDLDGTGGGLTEAKRPVVVALMPLMRESDEFGEGDVVIARHPLLLASRGTSGRPGKRAVPPGTLLRLGPAQHTATGTDFHAEVLGADAASGFVSPRAIDKAPRIGPTEQALLESLPTFARVPAARMPPRGAQQFVQIGIHRARGHGLSDTHGLYLYIGLMMQLGVDFDDDPFLPWARATLQGAAASAQPKSEPQRVHALYESATSYSQRVMGPELRHLRSALLKASRLRLDDLPSAGSGFIERMNRLLRDLYPQRLECAAADALRQIVSFCSDPADKSVTSRGLAVQVAIRFALGHGAFHDPRFPQFREARENTVALFTSLQGHLQQELRDRGWK